MGNEDYQQSSSNKDLEGKCGQAEVTPDQITEAFRKYAELIQIGGILYGNQIDHSSLLQFVHKKDTD